MLKKYFWYFPKTKLNSPDAVHQVLAHGSLKDIKKMKEKLSINQLKRLFTDSPKKTYTPSSLNFVKNFILKIKGEIDEQRYLKNTPRIIK